MLECIDELSREKRFDVMIELFYRDLETWFNAATFYCESCVDEFIELWPGIYDRDLDFQANSISLDTFYDGGRIREFFTKKEFLELSNDIMCEKCDNKISYNIYPYDLNFRVPENFESNIEEIANIANRTPFLLMNHKFSKKVYDEIKSLSENIELSFLSNPLYRARSFCKEYSYNNSDFLAPPKKVIKECRYNHAGKQVLYLAEDILTCYFEMRKPDTGIMLAELEINQPLKVLDLNSEELKDNDLIQAIQVSSLMSSPSEGEGWYNPHYVFTRFISDVALSVGFDAIRYPSVRLNTGYNIVILNYEKFKNIINVVAVNYVDDALLKTQN